MARSPRSEKRPGIRARKTAASNMSNGLNNNSATAWESMQTGAYFWRQVKSFFGKYFIKHASQILLFFFLVAALTAFTYVVSLPERYEVNVGDVSQVDITSQRDIIDRETTNRRAEQAALNIPQVYKRSVEESDLAVARVQLFYSLVDQTRAELKEIATPKVSPPAVTPTTTTAAATVTSTPAAAETAASSTASAGGGSATDPAASTAPAATTQTVPTQTTAATTPTETPSSLLTYTPEQIDTYAQRLINRSSTSLGFELLTQHASMLISLEDSFYQSIKEQSITIAQQIMSNAHDSAGLSAEIDARVQDLTQSVNLYKNEYASVASVLTAFLKPNVMLDEDATEKARAAESARIFSNPTMIPAGTRILSIGDVIDAKTYGYLEELNLIQQPGFDYTLLFQIFALMTVIALSVVVFLSVKLKTHSKSRRDILLILLTIIFIYVLAAFLTKFSVYAAPLYFLAIVLTIHFSFEIGIVISILTTIALIPFISSTGALFTVLFGLFCISLIAEELKKLRNNAWLIAVSLFSPALMVVVYGVLVKNPWGTIGQNALIAGLCGGLCAVAALGVQPLLEILSSSVSATHLIKLAQPSQPLLRRLFLEAPGTYQHSMMVANLAEKGAEVIGADSLLVRVGAYYHDIGKMDHPEVFTENQTDYNPHDYLTPQESVSLIIGHVEGGLKTARRHRLPLPLQNFIFEHHGNTLQASFYYKAVEEAELKGEPVPSEDDFRYPWPIPASRETAIVMLADSLEAAIRSTQTKDLAGAEKVARNIVKIKNEQNQLINSGLSYQEVEQLILSFVQTYQGQFHERVRYPDARPVSKHPKQIQPSNL